MLDVVGRPTRRGLTWVWVQDDLDLDTVAAARTALSRLFADGAAPGCVLVHLGGERFVDLRGLRLLLDTADEVARRGGCLAVVAPSRSFRRLVDLVDRRGRLTLFESADRAVRWGRRRVAR